MSKGRLMIINFIGLIVVVGLIAAGGYFYYQKANYISTDDASVSANITQVIAPVSGLLTNWNVKEGEKVSANDVIGDVSDGKQTVPVNSEESGMVIKNEINGNQLVQAGQVLAETADLDHRYITANIKETDLKNVSVGNNVDITVDGDSGTSFSGTVEEIGYATNSVFSALPSENSSGNYTKVTQTVPVKITIQSPTDKVLPGMNAEVKISK